MKEQTKEVLFYLTGLAFTLVSVLLLLGVVFLLEGCSSPGAYEAGVGPAPAVKTIVHGYETVDGTVVRYSDVETGERSAEGPGRNGDYSDRATAR